MKTISQKPLPKVKGKTIIDHYIRTQLNLNVLEYVMLDFAFNWFFCMKTTYCSMDFYEHSGYPSSIDISDTEIKLQEKGFLDSIGQTTEKWNKYFQVNESDFEELWKLYHEGNKQKAKIAYQKCRKITNHATLLDAAKKYLKFKAFKEQFLEHTSTWLNPANLSWEQDYSIPAETNQNVEPKLQQKPTIHP